MIQLSLNCADEAAARRFLNGPRWCGVVAEFDEWMRAQIKYQETPAKLDEARQHLHALLGEYGLSLLDEE